MKECARTVVKNYHGIIQVIDVDSVRKKCWSLKAKDLILDLGKEENQTSEQEEAEEDIIKLALF